MSDWLPIEIAPRDGDDIRLRWPDGRTFIGHWDAAGERWVLWFKGAVFHDPPTQWQPLR